MDGVGEFAPRTSIYLVASLRSNEFIAHPENRDGSYVFDK